jgi:hypothetical protein
MHIIVGCMKQSGMHHLKRYDAFRYAAHILQKHRFILNWSYVQELFQNSSQKNPLQYSMNQIL